MQSLTAWLFASRTQTISPEQALEIARTHAERQGWPFHPEFSVNRTAESYRVMTNVPRRGGNVTIHVSCNDGAVLQAGFAKY